MVPQNATDMTKRGNGEGTVREVRKGRWEARITVGKTDDGRIIRKKVTGRTQGEALERMREARNDADGGITPVRRDLSVETFLNDWLDNDLAGTVAPATEAQYRQVVRLYIVPRIGRKRLRTLTAGDVARMLQDMAKPTAARKKGYSPTARRLARGTLRRAIRYAERQGLVQRNVAAIAAGPKKQQTQGRTMDQAQVAAFMAAIEEDRLRAAYLVGLGLGLRVSELGGLSWSDVHLNTKPARIDVARGLKRVSGMGLIAEDLKTAKSRRTLNLPNVVAEALRAHRKQTAAERLALGDRWPARPLGHEFVFRTVNGLPLDAGEFWRALSAATERAKI